MKKILIVLLMICLCGCLSQKHSSRSTRSEETDAYDDQWLYTYKKDDISLSFSYSEEEEDLLSFEFVSGDIQYSQSGYFKSFDEMVCDLHEDGVKIRFRYDEGHQTIKVTTEGSFHYMEDVDITGTYRRET